MNSFERRIDLLPKIELHIHLEGAIRRETAFDMARRHGKPLSPDSLPDNPEFEDLTDFVIKVRHVLSRCLITLEDYGRAAVELFQDLADQNVRYAEVSFDPGRVLRMGLPLPELLDVLNDTRQAVQKSRPIRIGLIAAFGRDYSGEEAAGLVRQLVDLGLDDIVGVDLHGDESAGSAETFVKAFDLARRAGLGLRAHAGEGLGASSIREALDVLNVSRIAHGVRAVEDPQLMDYISNRPVTLDVCPTSNVMLKVAPSLDEHPVRKLFDAGIRLSVSSDDPLFFNTNITKEYYLLVEHLNFNLDELKQVNRYATMGAFLPEDEKRELLKEMESDWSGEENH